MAVVTQSVVQDSFWVHEAAQLMRKTTWPVYFVVPRDRSDADVAGIDTFYAVITLSMAFKIGHDDAWTRVACKGDPFLLELRYSKDDRKAAGTWDAVLVQHPETVPDLKNHGIRGHDIVVRTRRPRPTSNRGADFQVKTFPDRDTAHKSGGAQ